MSQQQAPCPGLTPGTPGPIVRSMALQDFLRLFWFRSADRDVPTPVPRWRTPSRVHVGMRVQLKIPIASPHTTWIPAGATGTVMGGDAKARQVSIELDTPRTIITVPWNWVEEEPEPSTAESATASPDAQ